MGYTEETTKQYKVYAPDLGYTIRSSVVQFDESIAGGTIDLKLRTPSGPQGTANELPVRNPRGRPTQTIQPVDLSQIPATLNNFDVVIPALREPDSTPAMKPTPFPGPGLENEGRPVTDEKAPVTDEKAPATDENPPAENCPVRKEPTLTVASTEAPKRYFLRKRKLSLTDDDDDGRVAKVIRALLAIAGKESSGDSEQALIATLAGTIPIPQSYNEAVSDPEYGPHWQEAIEAEIQSLTANKTWIEEIRPKGCNEVSTKWVFTVKTNPDGSIERFKARLVARGFSQVHGEDYFETFAPTVRIDTLRMLLALVAAEDLECYHFDIKNAFTESTLAEKIYLSQPQGVAVRDGHVLRVLRSLYGLKQAARDWNLLCRDHLISGGFIQSKADPCLFTLPDKSMVILVYVDDIVAAARMVSQIDWFDSHLASRFNTKNLGEIQKILGIRVTRNRKDRTLFIDQEQYLETVLNRFGISEEKHRPKQVPLADYSELRPSGPEDARIDVTEYQQIIGSLMYASVNTRPDIAYSQGKLSQYLRDPAEHHGHAVKNQMRYLRSTISQRIRYGPSTDRNLILYSDADWAGDKTDRKSTSGNVAMLYGGPIAWRSIKQSSVSGSSTESEYIAMSICARLTQWMAQLLTDMGYPEYIGQDSRAVAIRGDNQGALALVKNPHLHERSKHIDISYHTIRDLSEKGKISVAYVPTDEMAADGFTKPLARTAFERFKRLLGLETSRSAVGKQ